MYPEKERHAVVEKVIEAQTYIPNTIQMAEDAVSSDYRARNEGRRSTYSRQLAMTAVMA